MYIPYQYFAGWYLIGFKQVPFRLVLFQKVFDLLIMA